MNVQAHTVLTPRHLATALLMALVSMSAAHAQQTSITQYEYDAAGNRTKVTDPRGQATDYSYDSLNRLIQTQFPSPVPGPRPVIGQSYDGQDQLTQVSDPKGLTTTYTYDVLGRVLDQSSPDSGTTTRTYDAAGNLKTRKDARGKNTKYEYDALNRLTTITYADKSMVVMTYDTGTNVKGKLIQIKDASGQTDWTYNPLGQITSKQQTILTRSYQVGYAYDGFGRLSEVSYPSGLKTIRGYDAAGRVNTLHVQGSGAPILIYEVTKYAPFGGPIDMRHGNNQMRSQSYDLDGRLASYTRDDGFRILTYDTAGRITEVSPTNPLLAQTYSYDNNDRLTGWTSPATSQSFAYDLSGDRTEAVIGGNAYAYSTPLDTHRLASVTGPTPKTNTYDAAGHLISDGTYTYTYDARGRLTQAVGAGLTTTYTLDGLGQRVRKKNANATRYFVYDEAGQLLGEYDNGGPVQEYVWVDGQLTTLLRGTPAAPKFYSVENDHLGAPRQVRDNKRKRRWEWDADPFGMLPPNSDPQGLGDFTLNLRFPGQYFDQETNLHYNYFRDYDPMTGRYVQSDPIGLEGGINTYTYGEGNPMSYVDPLGLSSGKPEACLNEQCPKEDYRKHLNCVSDCLSTGYKQNQNSCNTLKSPQQRAQCIANAQADRSSCIAACDGKWPACAGRSPDEKAMLSPEERSQLRQDIIKHRERNIRSPLMSTNEK